MIATVFLVVFPSFSTVLHEQIGEESNLGISIRDAATYYPNFDFIGCVNEEMRATLAREKEPQFLFMDGLLIRAMGEEYIYKPSSLGLRARQYCVRQAEASRRGRSSKWVKGVNTGVEDPRRSIKKPHGS